MFSSSNQPRVILSALSEYDEISFVPVCVCSMGERSPLEGLPHIVSSGLVSCHHSFCRRGAQKAGYSDTSASPTPPGVSVCLHRSNLWKLSLWWDDVVFICACVSVHVCVSCLYRNLLREELVSDCWAGASVQQWILPHLFVSAQQHLQKNKGRCAACFPFWRYLFDNLGEGSTAVLSQPPSNLRGRVAPTQEKGYFKQSIQNKLLTDKQK